MYILSGMRGGGEGDDRDCDEFGDERGGVRKEHHLHCQCGLRGFRPATGGDEFEGRSLRDRPAAGTVVRTAQAPLQKLW